MKERYIDDYQAGLEEQIMMARKHKPALQPLSNRQKQSLKEQWENLTNNLYNTLTKYDKFDLLKELGEFKFNNSFLNKVEEYIEQLRLVIEEKGRKESGLSYKEVMLHVSTDDGVITPDLNNDCLASSELIGFHLRFQIIYKNYFAHISKAFKEKNYEKLKEVIDQHPSIDDSKIEILSRAIEQTKDTEIVNWLLENITYTDDNIYSLYRTECFKEAPDNIVDALINHSSTERGISDGIFHKAMSNQYANRRYEDAIKTFDKITKDQDTKKYYPTINPKSQEYNIVVGLYYTGLCYKYLGKIKDACEAFQYIKENVTDSYLIEKVKIIESADRELTKLHNKKTEIDIQDIQKKWNNEDLLLKTSQEKDLQSSLVNLSINLYKLSDAFNKRIEQEKDNTDSHDYKKLNDDIKTQLLKFKYINLKELAPEAAIIKAFPNIEAIKKQFSVDNEQTKKYDNALQLINNTLITCDQVCDLLGVNPEPIPDIQEYDDRGKNTGHTALHRAVSSGNSDTVKSIIDKMNPDDIGKHNNTGNTALHFAAGRGNAEITKLIIDKMDPEDISKQDNAGQTALHRAISSGKLDTVKLIIDKMNPDDIGKQNNIGQTALDFAAGRGNAEITKLIIDKMNPEDHQYDDNNNSIATKSKKELSEDEIIIQQAELQLKNGENYESIWNFIHSKCGETWPQQISKWFISNVHPQNSSNLGNDLSLTPESEILPIITEEEILQLGDQNEGS